MAKLNFEYKDINQISGKNEVLKHKNLINL
jgi:hypothetical protein